MSLPEIPDLITIAPSETVAYDYAIAILKDDVVYQVINTDGQSAALYLSNPTFVQVNRDEVLVGHVYDPKTKTFLKQE